MSVGCQVPDEVRGGDASVHEDVAAGDEGAVGSHEECADGADLAANITKPARGRPSQDAILRAEAGRDPTTGDSPT